MPLKMSLVLPAIVFATPAVAHVSAAQGAHHALEHALLMTPALVLLVVGGSMAVRKLLKKHD